VKGTEGLGMTVLQSLGSAGATLIGILITVLLVPVVLVYFMRDWDRLIAFVDGLVRAACTRRSRRSRARTDAVLAGVPARASSR